MRGWPDGVHFGRVVDYLSECFGGKFGLHETYRLA